MLDFELIDNSSRGGDEGGELAQLEFLILT
jgi:hypothetical protein